MRPDFSFKQQQQQHQLTTCPTHLQLGGLVLGCVVGRRFAGLEACFLLVTVRFFLFLVDQVLSLQPLLRSAFSLNSDESTANKKKLARITALYK